jgi:hypothetical protein
MLKLIFASLLALTPYAASAQTPTGIPGAPGLIAPGICVGDCQTRMQEERQRRYDREGYQPYPTVTPHYDPVPLPQPTMPPGGLYSDPYRSRF